MGKEEEGGEIRLCLGVRRLDESGHPRSKQAVAGGGEAGESAGYGVDLGMYRPGSGIGAYAMTAHGQEKAGRQRLC